MPDLDENINKFSRELNQSVSPGNRADRRKMCVTSAAMTND